MQQTRTTEQTMDDMRKMPLFRQLVPAEAGIGWPVPLRKENRIYVTFPFFGKSSKGEEGKTVLYPPIATLTLDWATLVPVEYVALRFNHPWPEGNWEAPLGTFPHPAIAQVSVAQYKAKRSELLALYDEMFRRLAQNQPFPVDWKTRFSTLLSLLIEPPLVPYYRALAPRFYERFLP